MGSESLFRSSAKFRTVLEFKATSFRSIHRFVGHPGWLCSTAVAHQAEPCR
ncbi:hypothetical protein NPIL_495931, partial [Nephila pilipes]